MAGGRQMRRRDCVVGLAATLIGLPGRAFSQQAPDPRYIRVLASGANGQFVFSDDRLSVRVDVRDMPLGEILRHLLNNIPADIKWMDPALERQPTTGSFNGPIANVVRRCCAAPISWSPIATRARSPAWLSLAMHFAVNGTQRPFRRFFRNCPRPEWTRALRGSKYCRLQTST